MTSKLRRLINIDDQSLIDWKVEDRLGGREFKESYAFHKKLKSVQYLSLANSDFLLKLFLTTAKFQKKRIKNDFVQNETMKHEFTKATARRIDC